MKRTVIFVAICLTFVMIITAALASEKSTPSKTRQITGNVTALDINSGTITVKKKNREVTMNFEEMTRVIECTPKPDFSVIKVGDRVTAKYKETVNKNTAKSITIKK